MFVSVHPRDRNGGFVGSHGGLFVTPYTLMGCMVKGYVRLVNDKDLMSGNMYADEAISFLPMDSRSNEAIKLIIT